MPISQTVHVESNITKPLMIIEGKGPKSTGRKDPKSAGGKDPKSAGGKDLKSTGGKDPKSAGGKDLKSAGGKDLKSAGGKYPRLPAGGKPRSYLLEGRCLENKQHLRKERLLVQDPYGMSRGEETSKKQGRQVICMQTIQPRREKITLDQVTLL